MLSWPEATANVPVKVVSSAKSRHWTRNPRNVVVPLRLRVTIRVSCVRGNANAVSQLAAVASNIHAEKGRVSSNVRVYVFPGVYW